MSRDDFDAWLMAWYELEIGGARVEDCYLGRGDEEDVMNNLAPADGTEGGNG